MKSCPFQGVICRPLDKHTDDRGWLTELFRIDELSAQNVPLMTYVSMTRPGVVRGPHEHRTQSDMFCFIGPSTFRLYLWENRHSEKEYGKRWTVECGEHNHMLAIVPPGVVHAYKNIGTVDGIVFNAPNQLYRGRGRDGEVDEIRHEDSADGRFLVD